MRYVNSTLVITPIITPIIALIITLITLTSCTATQTASTETAPEQIRMSKVDVNLYPITKLVCSPFGGDPDVRSNQGLKADLYQLPTGATAPHTVADMIAQSVKSDRTLFFSHLNVATRRFDLGFANPTGVTIKSDIGETLIENFALRFKSVLRLAPEQTPGLYEFALLSDDGAILKLRDRDGVYRPNVINDGDHMTRFGCGTSPIAMARDSEHPMVLDYYQGPRYHISLILLMREYKTDRTEDRNGKDPACGISGNSTWFDPSNNSAPKRAYTDLLERGWKPLNKDNYAVANEVMFNPCKEGETPLISNFKLVEKYNDGFLMSWQTDIPATDQLVATSPTGTQSITTADNGLRTEHLVRISGLNAATTYGLQAVSISDTLGRAISPSLALKTDF